MIIVKITFGLRKMNQAVCFYSYLKIRRDQKKDLNAKLISYDYINNNGHTLLDAVGRSVDYEKELLISQVLDEIKSLNHNEQMLIKGLYINGKTLREMSEEIGIPVMTLQNRKKKILRKLKNKINNYYLKVKRRTHKTIVKLCAFFSW